MEGRQIFMPPSRRHVSRKSALRRITSCFNFRYDKQLIAKLVGRHEDLFNPKRSCLPRATWIFWAEQIIMSPSKLCNKCIFLTAIFHIGLCHKFRDHKLRNELNSQKSVPEEYQKQKTVHCLPEDMIYLLFIYKSLCLQTKLAINCL